MEQFIKEHIETINLERARLLLLTPVEELQIITQKENLEFQLNDSLKDSLPFKNLVPTIAQQLPGVPIKPKLSIHFDKILFKELFVQYCKEFQGHFDALCIDEKKRMTNFQFD